MIKNGKKPGKMLSREKANVKHARNSGREKPAAADEIAGRNIIENQPVAAMEWMACSCFARLAGADIHSVKNDKNE